MGLSGEFLRELNGHETVKHKRWELALGAGIKVEVTRVKGRIGLMMQKVGDVEWRGRRPLGAKVDAQNQDMDFTNGHYRMTCAAFAVMYEHSLLSALDDYLHRQVADHGAPCIPCTPPISPT